MKKDLNNYIDKILASSEVNKELVRVKAAEENSAPEGVVEIINNLAVLLSDFEVMKGKLLGFHWNVEGKNFLEYHENFDELWEDFHSYADLTAERIRQLGQYAPSNLKTFVETTRLDLVPDHAEDKELHKILHDDFVLISNKMQEDIYFCGDKGDFITQDILIEIKRSIDKRTWFLRSLLK